MTLQPFNPSHPGGMIERTYIEPFVDVSVASISRELGVSKRTFSRLISGKSDISPEMAVRLSVVLGQSAESWLALQASYDLWIVRQTVNTDELNRMQFEVI